MVVSPSESRLEHIHYLVNQAKDEHRPFWHQEVGYNYRMTNLEASLGLAQLGRIRDFMGIKNRIRSIYQEAFREVEEVRLQEQQPESNPVWWFSSISLDLKKVDVSLAEFQNQLREKGIPSRRIFRPLGDLPPYQSFQPNPTPFARRLFDQSISLPSSTLNREIDIRQAAKRIVDLLASLLSRKHFQSATLRPGFFKTGVSERLEEVL